MEVFQDLVAEASAYMSDVAPCVAFDAISCRENDGEPWSLAEPVLGVDRYGDD